MQAGAQPPAVPAVLLTDEDERYIQSLYCVRRQQELIRKYRAENSFRGRDDAEDRAARDMKDEQTAMRIALLAARGLDSHLQRTLRDLHDRRARVAAAAAAAAESDARHLRLVRDFGPDYDLLLADDRELSRRAATGRIPLQELQDLRAAERASQEAYMARLLREQDIPPSQRRHRY